VKGIEPSYSAWNSPDFRNIFKSRTGAASGVMAGDRAAASERARKNDPPSGAVLGPNKTYRPHDPKVDFFEQIKQLTRNGAL
jgi:hypothetical protein